MSAKHGNGYRSLYGINRKAKRTSPAGGDYHKTSRGIGKRWPDFPPPHRRTAK